MGYGQVRLRPSCRRGFIRHPVGAVREPPYFADEENSRPYGEISEAYFGIGKCSGENGRLIFLPPHPCDDGLNLLLKAIDQFAVGLDYSLLGFDLSDDDFLSFNGW